MKLSKDQPIGIFDSGVGGLTVASGIQKYLPKEAMVYFGDTAHLPYGDKSDEVISYYCRHIADFLIARGCKMLVIACNTASSVAYDSLKAQLGDRIELVDVIEPIVETVAQSEAKSVGIIATPTTTKKGVYVKKLKAQRPDLKIHTVAARSLASIIEEGLHEDPAILKAVVAHYFSSQEMRRIDSLILACTHYPIIKHAISEFYGHQIDIYDSTDLVAWKVQEILEKRNLLNQGSKREAAHRFYVSDATTESFERVSSLFFGQRVKVAFRPFWEELSS